MPKKYETGIERAARYNEELKLNTTSEKGVVRTLTPEEVEYRKGFILTMIRVGAIKNDVENGLASPMELSKISGESSAFASIRAETEYRKRSNEKKQLVRLQRKYPGRTRYSRRRKTRTSKKRK